MKTETNSPDRLHVEPSQKRVRTFLGGDLVADTTQARLVWEVPYYPAYYVPTEDIKVDLVASSKVSHSPSRGDARHYTIKAGGKEAPDAAWQYVDSPIEQIRDLIRIDWNAMDGWFEEDEEVFTHPRDPYKRVDVLPSSRQVRVEVDGVVLADSTSTHVLFETTLPPRWYIPKVDVRMDLLVPTDKVTHCPYKGQAQYWSVQVGGNLIPDLAWSYRAPFPESIKTAGLVCFYNEAVDLYIDSELQQRPETPFSKQKR